MIKCILFDLDDTLCDYVGAVNSAKVMINDKLSEMALKAEVFWELYHRLNESLYRRFMAGLIDRDEYRRLRFETPLAELGVRSKSMPSLFNYIFMRETNSNIKLFEDAFSVLGNLQLNGFVLALLTNGPADGQRIKIRQLGISGYFDHIFISEEIGYAKPGSEIYQYVLFKTGLKPAQVLAIGDSVEYDMHGAESVLMPRVLLDRYNENQHYDGRRIHNLYDVFDVIAEHR